MTTIRMATLERIARGAPMKDFADVLPTVRSSLRKMLITHHSSRDAFTQSLKKSQQPFAFLISHSTSFSNSNSFISVVCHHESIRHDTLNSCSFVGARLCAGHCQKTIRCQSKECDPIDDGTFHGVGSTAHAVW